MKYLASFDAPAFGNSAAPVAASAVPEAPSAPAQPDMTEEEKAAMLRDLWAKKSAGEITDELYESARQYILGGDKTEGR